MGEMKISLKNIFVFIGISIGVIMFILAILDMNNRENSINENKFETIGKVYKFHSNRSFNHYYFKYYYKGIEYNNYQNISSFGEDKCVGKFYKVDLSTKNPQYSIIFLSEEITDQIEIRKVGFALDHI